MWKLIFIDAARFDLGKIDASNLLRVNERLAWLVENFDSILPVPLAGEWRGYFKFRIGDLRVIYNIDWKEKGIVVYAIGKREMIYKNAFRRE